MIKLLWLLVRAAVSALQLPSNWVKRAQLLLGLQPANLEQKKFPRVLLS